MRLDARTSLAKPKAQAASLQSNSFLQLQCSWLLWRDLIELRRSHGMSLEEAVVDAMLLTAAA